MKFTKIRGSLRKLILLKAPKRLLVHFISDLKKIIRTLLSVCIEDISDFHRRKAWVYESKINKACNRILGTIRTPPRSQSRTKPFFKKNLRPYEFTIVYIVKLIHACYKKYDHIFNIFMHNKMCFLAFENSFCLSFCFNYDFEEFTLKIFE